MHSNMSMYIFYLYFHVITKMHDNSWNRNENKNIYTHNYQTISLAKKVINNYMTFNLSESCVFVIYIVCIYSFY